MKQIGLFISVLCVVLTSNFAFAGQLIKFGVVHFYPPFVYADRNHPESAYGFDVDLARAICQQLQATCTFVPMPFRELFKSLDDNTVDAAMGAISITFARKAKYEFSLPYFKSTMSYLGRNADNFTIDAAGLRGKKIGVIEATTFESYVEQTYGDLVKVKKYHMWEDAVADLADNKIDLVLMDTPVARQWVILGSGQFRIIGQSLNSNVPFDEGYGIALNGDNKSLTLQINQALVDLVKNGTYDRLRYSYLNN